jgi:signal transduction histidine kinase
MVRVIPALFLFYIFLCTVLPCAAASAPLVLHGNTESSPLSGHMDILEDKSGKLTIGEVSSPVAEGMFKPDMRGMPHFGATSSVYWVRFTIGNETTAEKRWLLELDFPLMDYLDLYVPVEDGGFELMQAGDMRPMIIRKFRHRNPVFPLVIDGPAKTFYLRVDARGVTRMPLTLWTPEAFARMDSRRDMIHGGYFGAMMVMVVYNLFIFLSLRDKNYLYYILDIFCFALYVFCVKGFLMEFVSAEMPLVNGYAFMLVVPPLLTGLLFCRSFLETVRNTPFIDRVLKMLMLAAILSIPAIFVLPPDVWKQVLAVVTLFASITTLIAGLVCLARGYHPARYFVGARIFRVFGTLSFALPIILSMNLLSNFGLQTGSILEVVLLSFALADRINMMRREKEEAQAEAIRSSHLAALGELAAGVAHEINTPVNTIINSADLILENEDRKATEHDVDVIKKQGRRIATIVKSLLFFSRSPEKDKVPFAVSELLQGTLDMIGARFRKEKIKLTIRIPPGLIDVMVHPQQIEQVFLNILTNAMYALEERHGAAQDGKALEIVASEIFVNDRPYVRVTFLDNGIGIPASLLDTVKDPFVTTKKTGTGLGLSISRRIIIGHGGAIGLESRVGEYTKVSIDLPVVMNNNSPCPLLS